MNISLLTRKPTVFSLDYVKEKIRAWLNRKTGPISVLESMERGLRELNIEFSTNKRVSEITYVISGINTLKYALEQKKKGLINLLIVGPAIVILPNEAQEILLSEGIDVIILPSQWNKDLYCSKYPQLENKIAILPAGVKDPAAKDVNRNGILIYNKSSDEIMLKEIVKSITNKTPYQIINYGNFKQDEYYKLLEKYRHLIYLSPSESQGIALQEAWIRGVPTFVWNRGYWEYNGKTWLDDKISAPYLTEECGMFFKDTEDFNKKIDAFLAKDFRPREYCLHNLSDKIFAQKLIGLIENYEKNH
ncbi:MAG: hypothetical protein WCO10_00630 [bacterium]